MWFREDNGRGSFRRYGRRLHNTRQSILMVSTRTSDQRKRWRQKIATILVVLVAVGGFLLMAKAGAARLADRLWIRNERFLLEKLVVRSDGRLREEHVRLYGGVTEGMGLFQIDLCRLYTNLMAIPVAEAVSLERQLPDTLIVNIRERVPVARLNVGPRMPTLALDRNGFVLPPAMDTPSLPLIHGYAKGGIRPGLQLSDRGIRAALSLLLWCENNPPYANLFPISLIDISSPYYITVHLARGERVLMPYENFEVKLKPACTIIKRSADMGQAVAELDMTVDRNFPVKYR